MSLVHLSNVCSHLQNASRARLGLTSIPYTSLHLALSHELQKSGFVSTVTVGGPTPPSPSPLLSHPPESTHSEDGTPPITQQNIASRRVWLGLKYWNNEPVIGKMRMESKPTRRIWLAKEELGDVARGRGSGYVKGLRQVGECMFVTTDRGVMEVRECIERGLGGMVLCRVW
ncbi:MAG: hypothetical protein MMC23_002293 [Stictis urceolatum]|nr:hypothetical protein [Stictis urceolata]